MHYNLLLVGAAGELYVLPQCVTAVRGGAEKFIG